MIFQHTWEQVLTGAKTQTARIVKDTDVASGRYLGDGTWVNQHYEPVGVEYGDLRKCKDGRTRRRMKWQPGKVYAVQPGRGKKAVGHIRIIRVRYVDVRQYSKEDIAREGFPNRESFLRTWCKMHDRTRLSRMFADKPLHDACKMGHDSRYRAWAIEFELV